MSTPTQDWRARAACADPAIDPELFYYPRSGDYADAAKTVCQRCPVQHHCLDDALARGDNWGVLGGLTARERGRRGRRPAPRRPESPRRAIRYHLDVGRGDAEILARLDVSPRLIAQIRNEYRERKRERGAA